MRSLGFVVIYVAVCWALPAVIAWLAEGTSDRRELMWEMIRMFHVLAGVMGLVLLGAHLIATGG